MKRLLRPLCALAALVASAGASAHAAERYAVSYDAARAAWTVRVEAARQRYDKFVQDRVPRRFRIELVPDWPAIPQAVRQFPIKSIYNDPTLQPGDIYASNSGFLVFQGLVGRRHRQADFVALQSPDRSAHILRIASDRDVALHTGVFLRTAAR